jgi:hypothetical protein
METLNISETHLAKYTELNPEYVRVSRDGSENLTSLIN